MEEPQIQRQRPRPMYEITVVIIAHGGTIAATDYIPCEYAPQIDSPLETQYIRLFSNIISNMFNLSSQCPTDRLSRLVKHTNINTYMHDYTAFVNWWEQYKRAKSAKRDDYDDTQVEFIKRILELSDAEIGTPLMKSVISRLSADTSTSSTSQPHIATLKHHFSGVIKQQGRFFNQQTPVNDLFTFSKISNDEYTQLNSQDQLTAEYSGINGAFSNLGPNILNINFKDTRQFGGLNTHLELDKRKLITKYINIQQKLIMNPNRIEIFENSTIIKRISMLSIYHLFTIVCASTTLYTILDQLSSISITNIADYNSYWKEFNDAICANPCVYVNFISFACRSSMSKMSSEQIAEESAKATSTLRRSLTDLEKRAKRVGPINTLVVAAAADTAAANTATENPGKIRRVGDGKGIILNSKHKNRYQNKSKHQREKNRRKNDEKRRITRRRTRRRTRKTNIK